MIHESKIAFTRVDDNGNDKVIKERYLIAEAESFGDAEEQTYDFCEGETGLDVIDVKRSKIKEILNSRNTGDDKIFVADIADVQHNDDGEEVELVYKVALFALNVDAAYNYIKSYLKQGYNMTLVGLKKTKYNEVI
jgi:hypothetical protein